MRHSVFVALVCVALFAAAYAVFWYAGLFDNLGWHGTVAAVLGVLLTSGLAIGLMTALFHSSRTRRDEEAHRPEWDQHR